MDKFALLLLYGVRQHNIKKGALETIYIAPQNPKQK